MAKPTKDLTQTELIKGCQKGKESCQYELVKLYSSKLLGISRRYAKDLSSAEDILQETFIKAFKYFKKFDANKGNLDSWLVRIAINTAIDYNKKYGVVYEHDEFLINNHIRTVSLPKALSNLRVEEIVNVIKLLPIGYQTVFNLYVIEQYSHAEIAEMLNIQEATSRSQLNKARKMLQKLLTENETYLYEPKAI